MNLHRVLIVSMLVLCTSLVGCASDAIRHGWVMRGQVLAMDDTVATVCVGTRDGAKIGQVFTVQHYTVKYGVGFKGANSVSRTDVGQVKITELFDEHYARAVVVRGMPAINDVVELEMQ